MRADIQGFRVDGSGFIKGLQFRVWGSGFIRFRALGYRVLGLRIIIEGLGFSLRFRVC